MGQNWVTQNWSLSTQMDDKQKTKKREMNNQITVNDTHREKTVFNSV